MGRIRAAAVALAMVATAGAAVAANVVDVRVEGNERISDEEVLSHVRTRAGEPYDAARVKADQRRLIETGNYENVVARRSETDEGVVVTFEVTERPVIRSVQIFGNHAFDDAELMKLLPFATGAALDVAAVQRGRQALADHYTQQGYHDVDVSFDRERVMRRGEVVYRIREGVSTTVDDIVFDGNSFFTSLWLKQKIETTERLWPIIPGRLDRAQVAADAERIREMYRKDGFLAAEVGPEIVFSEDKQEAEVIFHIDEGPRYQVGAFRFEGNAVFADDELAERLELREGAYISPMKLRRAVRRVEDTYGQLGYIETRVTAQQVFREEPGVVDLVFSIHESAQYDVGDIVIRGNRVTRESVVRRNLTFFPRQRLDSTALERSRQQLLGTQLFETVEMRTVGDMPDTRDVVVDLTERDTAHIILGGAVGSDNGLVGTIMLVERNFDLFHGPRSFSEMFQRDSWRGGGQTLRITAEPGTEMMRFLVDWREPMLFDRPYSLGTKAYLFDRVWDHYDERRFGSEVSVGHMFPNRWYGEIAPRIEGVRIDDFDSGAPPEILAMDGQHTLFAVRSSLVRDRTDSRLHPTTGGRLSFGYEQVMGDWNYGRLEAGYRHYFTVFTDALERKHVLKARVSGGYLCGDAPVFDRYFGGGSAWMRGFAHRGISPRSAGTDEAIGGDFRLFAGCEYEYPILGEQLRGVVFLDTGTVEEDASISTYRASVGVGLRWTVPGMGPVPIKLDLGFPIAKHGSDDTQAFSFSIGWWF
ncbi:MAG: outer membrane protein assembly factor BamA [Phycisphaerae bacterium]|nr:outer membrane protein assembly factor BamA [Phycisphaerae bacterium]